MPENFWFAFHLFWKRNFAKYKSQKSKKGRKNSWKLTEKIMTTIPILEVISFSTEHSINKVQNIVKNTGKWTNQTKNVSLRGKEIYEIQAEFKLPKCKIEAIGNVQLYFGLCQFCTLDGIAHYLKSQMLVQNSISRVFHPNFLRQFFSWNQSCQ